MERFGSLDILVNNHAVQLIQRSILGILMSKAKTTRVKMAFALTVSCHPQNILCVVFETCEGIHAVGMGTNLLPGIVRKGVKVVRCLRLTA